MMDIKRLALILAFECFIIAVGLNNGTLHPVIGQQLSLEQAAQAHHDVLEQAHCGKVVLRV
ncbi:zinc-binding dehydrogenase [Planctomycetota bacterium]